ncbi:phosphatase PAP2 family protein [Antrihabitans sp. NCIMB 15449]|uniref:Phosphatase PAP2 family protein n=1 Tax=Antrihabitans spumae TaxID=3373370 RepID=A0ABW7JW02_9NOCA
MNTQPASTRLGTRLLASIAVVAALFTVVIAATIPASDGPNGLDRAAGSWVSSLLDDHHSVATIFAACSDPVVLLIVLPLALAYCSYRKRWRAALLVIAGPAVATAANAWLLKPLFDRQTDDYLAYPSGHTVALVATVTVLVLVARTGRQRAVILGGGAVALICAALGMIALGYHQLTDILGGIGAAASIVIIVATALDGPWLDTRCSDGA